MAKITVNDFLRKKAERKKISMITAYDYPFALIADEAGMDAILVGDSVGMVVQGLENTLPVTMDEMIYHVKMVSRAVKNAGRFLKEAGASAIKIEGGAEVEGLIRAMTRADIPVMAHIGLTPQAIHRMGGFKVQGRSEEAAKRLIEESHMVEDAGAYALLLEAIPMDLAKRITEELSIPTIGIGAGPHCDGQVLVLHDVLGLFERFVPKFIKRYADLRKVALDAMTTYRDEVEKGLFPLDEHSFK